MLKRMVHLKCRSAFYPLTEIARKSLQDSQVPWEVPFPNYSPPEYESPVLQNKPWADPPINDPKFHPKWNQLDGKINRKSHIGVYRIDAGRPLNPEGRTGFQGRGILGKWGPNHAADPIVTRWKIVEDHKVINPTSNHPVLQFCAIQRHDCGQWAIPGGMIDPGEQVTETLKREFLEEAFNSLESEKSLQEANGKLIEQFFENGAEIYKGYVDDPRNTDNAWMETVAVNFHDENCETVGKFQLQAGDDAKSVQWIDIDKNVELYASHASFIETVAKLHKAHW